MEYVYRVYYQNYTGITAQMTVKTTSGIYSKKYMQIISSQLQISTNKIQKTEQPISVSKTILKKAFRMPWYLFFNHPYFPYVLQKLADWHFWLYDIGRTSPGSLLWHRAYKKTTLICAHRNVRECFNMPQAQTVNLLALTQCHRFIIPGNDTV